MDIAQNKINFPCPVCTRLLDVRKSKKGKPYVVCSNCGIQMFIRERAGIEAFSALVERGENGGFYKTLRDLQNQYQKRCRNCHAQFWISEELIQTSWLDGAFQGFRCPECGEIYKSEESEEKKKS